MTIDPDDPIRAVEAVLFAADEPLTADTIRAHVGEDIDVHDAQYLVFDAKKAVEENNRHGVFTYCMSLDPKADRYVSRIFGMRNYMVLDRISRLPEKLPMLYMRVTN